MNFGSLVLTGAIFTIIGTKSSSSFSDIKEASQNQNLRLMPAYIKPPFLYKLDYNPIEGKLEVIFKFNDPNWKNLTVTLFRHSKSNEMDQQECQKLRTHSSLRHVATLPLDNQLKASFEGVKTGCYILQTHPGSLYNFFWLTSLDNVVDTNSWNVSLFIEARLKRKEVDVRWTWPPENLFQSFHFDDWIVELFFSSNNSIACDTRTHSDKRLLLSLPYKTKKETALQAVTFQNLTSGFYCIRLSPSSSLCPHGLCSPRASVTVILADISNEDDSPVASSVTSVVITITATVVVVGLTIFALLVFKWRIKIVKRKELYNVVSMVPVDRDAVNVLLLWSKSTPDKATSIEPAVSAFKLLLESYVGCKIFDVQDVQEMDKQERQKFYASPHEWLEEHIYGNKAKIILVGSEGARMLQKYRLEDSGSIENQEDGLFLYVLRKLKTDLSLKENYSKVFHVSFPDFNRPGVECNLDGVVPRMRFSIPDQEHVKKLKIGLLGLSEKEARKVKKPSLVLLEEYQSHLKAYACP